MTRLFRFAIHVACVIGLLVVVAIAGNKYAWMHEVDPSIAIGTIQDEAGDRALVAYVLLIAVAAAQAVLLAKSTAAGAKSWVGLLMLAATGLCAWYAIT
ncbi:hypothetical protein [Burkholderia ambifaria]|uniref:hypothetical protein n=1 Tax=Burkholderia ambifaria TaxID=152480 RepID=UPI00158A7F3C|nr:hypothetical protein [Burkholderia ambifaria]